MIKTRNNKCKSAWPESIVQKFHPWEILPDTLDCSKLYLSLSLFLSLFLSSSFLPLSMAEKSHLSVLAVPSLRHKSFLCLCVCLLCFCRCLCLPIFCLCLCLKKSHLSLLTVPSLRHKPCLTSLCWHRSGGRFRTHLSVDKFWPRGVDKFWSKCGNILT